MNLVSRVTSYPKFSLSISLLSILFIITFSYSEQVGIFKSGSPLNSSDTVKVIVPSGVVALSGSVPVEGDSTAGESNSTSLFFMVDHSGSMYNAYPELPDCPMDPGYNRMKLVSNIVDSLAAYANKYPNIECGLGVFGTNLYFDSSNCNLLTKLPNEDSSGMYLPLIELNKTYSDAQNKTGKEIIKDLVKIEINKILFIPTDTNAGLWDITGKDTSEYFQYNPGNGLQWFHISLLDRIDTTYNFLPTKHPNFGTGTSIDYGFKSAVAALKNSKNDKKDQFIIFLSDGMGDDHDFEDGFINGKDDPIPTTFTIFFTNSDTAPTLLKDMADSIKVNNYSESNPEHTTLKPFKNTTIDALVGYVMDSIVSIFEAGQTTKPNKIVINNDTSDIWDANNGNFTLSHPLALIGEETDFPIHLELTVFKDSVGQNDSIIQVKVDTSFSVLTTAVIDDNLKEEDADGDIEWWERNIKIFSNNNEKSSITELDRILNVTFNFDKLKSDYQYSNSKITIKCKNSGDSLTLDLDKKSDILFEKDLSIDPIGPVNYSDNLITPESTDEIIFTFRNNESYTFPLDTLQYRIDYNLSTEYEMTEGALFDDDANGICDRISIALNGNDDMLKDGAEEIAKKIQLPASRGLSVDSANTEDNVLNIFVSSSKGIDTDLNNDDKATVLSSSVVSSGGVLLAGEIDLIDSMAPVITRAILYDNPGDEVDSLLVEYSEEINSFDNEMPFYFYDNNSDKYDLKLKDYKFDKKSLKSSINKDNNKKISEGDSINIRNNSSVQDSKNILQNNEKNRKVEIEIIKSTIEVVVDEIIFIDPDGQGYPSLVKVSNNYQLNNEAKNNVEEIFTNYLESIKERELNVDSVYWKDDYLYLLCSQPNNNSIKTIVTDDDVFVLSSEELLTEGVLYKSQHRVPKDSMAPVLISALCVDSIANEGISFLVMEFSEKTQNPGSFIYGIPFLFLYDNDILSVKLNYLGFYNETKLKTIPVEKTDSEFWDEVDSVRINPKFGITDGNNEQLSDINRMVELKHLKIAPPLELELNTTMITPDDPDAYIVISPLKKLSVGDNQKISGTVTIIDNVGNHVIKDRELEYDGINKQAILKWDGKNDAGRKVGSGLYPILADIDPLESNIEEDDIERTSEKQQIRGTVGVKY